MLAALLPLLILILMRLVLLDARPVHHDEAVNGWFIDGLLQRGYYIYDPQNYHGPLFFYWTALSERIFGRSLTALRLPSVFFGALLTLAPFLYRRWIGLPAAFLASYLLALSPAMVFFSRYAIHETAFAFFEALFLALWLQIRADGWNLKRAVGLGLALGLMAGVKENFVILGAALFFSEVILEFLHRGRREASESPMNTIDARFGRYAAVAVSVAAVVMVLGFTGGFQDRDGVRKFFEAFLKWMDTGTQGNGHEKPSYYWLSLMGKYEWPALLGLLMIPVFWKRANPALQRVGLTGVVILGIYSVVRYKTPWCLLSFYWAFILFGAAFWMEWIQQFGQQFGKQGRQPEPQVTPRRVLAALGLVILGAGAGGSVLQALDAAYLSPDQDGHPYIYGQTYSDLIPPVERILERAKGQPQGSAGFRVQVMSATTWPLPFLLGELKKVGYYSESNVPPALDADVVILDENYVERYSGRLTGTYSHECVRSRQWAQRMCFFTRPSTPLPQR